MCYRAVNRVIESPRPPPVGFFHPFNVAAQRSDPAREKQIIVAVLFEHFGPRLEVPVPVRRLHELWQRFEGVRRRRISILEHCGARSQAVYVRACVSLIAVSSEVVGPQRVYEDKDDVESAPGGRARSALLFFPPIGDLLLGEVASDGVVIRPVSGDLGLRRVYIAAALVFIASVEKGRVSVTVEIKSPLGELEMLLGLRRAKKELRLEVLIIAEVKQSEDEAADATRGRRPRAAFSTWAGESARESMIRTANRRESARDNWRAEKAKRPAWLRKAAPRPCC